MAEQEFTMYKDMEPEEISRKFWGADYLVDLVMMVGLGFVIIAAAWMANKGQTWAFIPATIIAFIVFAALNARRLRNFATLQGILMVDCDSKKMERVCELSAKRTKKGAERIRFRTLHGMAMALNGKPDEALEMIDGLQRQKLQAADSLNVRSVRAAAYRMKGDAASAEAMVNEVQAIHDSLPDANPLLGSRRARPRPCRESGCRTGAPGGGSIQPWVAVRCAGQDRRGAPAFRGGGREGRHTYHPRQSPRLAERPSRPRPAGGVTAGR